KEEEGGKGKQEGRDGNEKGSKEGTDNGQLLSRERETRNEKSMVIGSLVAIVVVYLLNYAHGMGFMMRMHAKPPGDEKKDEKPK
ncbi:hypothetical protein CBR14_22965, partial [Cronobacter sakazakii]